MYIITLYNIYRYPSILNWISVSEIGVSDRDESR